MNLADELRKLTELHEAGHLTDQEFADAKRRLIADAGAEPPPLPKEEQTVPGRLPPPPPQQSRLPSAYIKKRLSLVGVGCLLGGLGLVCFVLAFLTIHTVIGPIVFGPLGLWLLFYGYRKESWCECSECGGKLSNARVSLCPHCNSSFSQPLFPEKKPVYQEWWFRLIVIIVIIAVVVNRSGPQSSSSVSQSNAPVATEMSPQPAADGSSASQSNTPVADNDASWTDLLNQLKDRQRNLKLTSEEHYYLTAMTDSLAPHMIKQGPDAAAEQAHAVIDYAKKLGKQGKVTDVQYWRAAQIWLEQGLSPRKAAELMTVFADTLYGFESFTTSGDETADAELPRVIGDAILGKRSALERLHLSGLTNLSNEERSAKIVQILEERYKGANQKAKEEGEAPNP